MIKYVDKYLLTMTMRHLLIIAFFTLIASCQISPNFDATSYSYLTDAKFSLQQVGLTCLDKDGNNYWAVRISNDAELFAVYSQYRDPTVYPAAQILEKLAAQFVTRVQSGKMDAVYCKDKVQIVGLAIDRLRQALATRK